MLVEASIAAGDGDRAVAAAERLAETAAAASSQHLAALARRAVGRVAVAQGDSELPSGISRLRSRCGRIWISRSKQLALASTLAGRSLSVSPMSPSATPEERWLPSTSLAPLWTAIGSPQYLRSLGVVARTGAKGAGLLTDA